MDDGHVSDAGAIALDGDEVGIPAVTTAETGEAPARKASPKGAAKGRRNKTVAEAGPGEAPDAAVAKTRGARARAGTAKGDEVAAAAHRRAVGRDPVDATLAARRRLRESIGRACARILAGGEGAADVPWTIPSHKGDIEVMAPGDWSLNAVKMLQAKYMRRAGVPAATTRVSGDAYPGVPAELLPSVPVTGATFGAETTATQVFDRLAGTWAFWMCRQAGAEGVGMVDGETAVLLRRTYRALLRRQFMAPNSPQWFNCGLHWAYGITGPAGGNHVIDPATQEIAESTSTYEHAQVHACFINSVSDDLVREGGIMDFALREAKIFKLGSGSGANVSNLRGDRERLSGGGISSGMLSFLKIGDSAAGAIKSGGTTRRAAKMIVVDDDHPQVEGFVEYKTREERKVAALVTGSILGERHGRAIYDAVVAGGDAEAEIAEAGRAAIQAGAIEATVARAKAGMPFRAEVYGTGWESEAYASVAGQNANNSVRVSDRFLEAVERDEDWDLVNRGDGKVSETIKARRLWDLINENAWASGDPGLQYRDTINSWHTSKNSGEIRGSNPCSEYFFLDNTGCNLASIRLTAMLRGEDYDVELLKAVSQVSTMVLDTSVTLGQYPSREIAEGTRDFRTLGLGFADLGGLLMRLGVPYDSAAGRTIGASLMSVITASAYEMSGLMAAATAPFPKWELNREPMADVIRRHRDAHLGIDRNVRSAQRIVYGLIDGCAQAAGESWDFAASVALTTGYRNAQVSVIAPTGTIGLVMDCDTTGVEPDFSLVKMKELAGGGWLTIANTCVPDGLRRLGYDEATIEAVTAHIVTNKGMDDCPLVRDEDRAAFDTASRNGKGTRYIQPYGHVDMMAALQPFVSGGISKTVNLPVTATMQDMADVHMHAWKVGVKSIAVYRDNSKLSQPLNAAAIEKVAGTTEMAAALTDAIKVGSVEGVASMLAAAEVVRGRHKLPSKRLGYTQKMTIAGHRVYLRTGEYADGSIGEMFVDMHKEGAAFRSLMNNFAMAVSLGLQYGVPLEEFVDAFTYTRFEPQGMVRDHDGIKMATSVLDLIFRDLAANYLGRTDLLNVKPQEVEASKTDLGGGHDEGSLAMPTPEQESAVLAMFKPGKPAAKAGTSESDGFLGIECQNPECGSMKVIRNGACALCIECGTSVGGC